MLVLNILLATLGRDSVSIIGLHTVMWRWIGHTYVWLFIIYLFILLIKLALTNSSCRNYVVQYVIESDTAAVSAKLLSQFKENFVMLSTQKFSSHVVEKCLQHIGDSRSRIVRELLSVPRFEQLLQDQYANYVIQSALLFTKVWKIMHSSCTTSMSWYFKVVTNYLRLCMWRRGLCMHLWLKLFVFTKRCAPVHIARGFFQETCLRSDASNGHICCCSH